MTLHSGNRGNRRHRGPRAKIGRDVVVRVAIGAIGAAILLWLAIASSGASILARNAGPAALRFAPWDARALGAAASFYMEGSPAGKSDRSRAIDLAQSALARDPMNVSAWRALAIQAAFDRKPDEATRIMRFSERLSRRDLPTQLWLIEDSVRRNDVDEALDHYGHALATNGSAADLLLPNLVEAVSQPNLRAPITAMLLDRPTWLPIFLAQFGQQAKTEAEAVRLLTDLRASGYVDALTNALDYPTRLAAAGEYTLAKKVYLAILPPGIAPITAEEAGFARTPRIEPFDWQYASGSNLRAGPDDPARDGGPPTLLIGATDGERGMAAQRLLNLQPGHYRVDVRVSSPAAPLPERAMLELTCASSPSLLASLSIVPASQPRSYATGFVVPGGCGAQWMRISYAAAEGFQASDTVIEALSIRRVRN